MMEEWIDILDENGNPTGRSSLRTEAHAKGWFHPCVHIWFYTPNGEVLVQQRGATKRTHPLLWDVSVAGHMAAGEAALDAAVREVEEEIGLQINAADLIKVGIYKSYNVHSAVLTDAEFLNTYIHLLSVPVDELVPQEIEVAALKLISLQEISAALHQPIEAGHVPHDEMYVHDVIEMIRKQL